LDQGHDGFTISVNVSGRQLQEAGFVDEVRSTLIRHRLPPGVLLLELTESVLVYDGSAVPERMKALKELGARIAIDDFGTGYSSLAYLAQFPIDMLKIDKSFIDDLGNGTPQGGALAHAIVSLAHTLHLEVVAEGIENVQQRDELWSIGCGQGQGYLYSKPVAPDQLSLLMLHQDNLGPAPLDSGQARVSRIRTPTHNTKRSTNSPLWPSDAEGLTRQAPPQSST
jgi:EAL domain-containing protein (putative c-di-GMP-specific phosphodiesterase class I)